jgi:hypothetical protein
MECDVEDQTTMAHCKAALYKRIVAFDHFFTTAQMRRAFARTSNSPPKIVLIGKKTQIMNSWYKRSKKPPTPMPPENTKIEMPPPLFWRGGGEHRATVVNLIE